MRRNSRGTFFDEVLRVTVTARAFKTVAALVFAVLVSATAAPTALALFERDCPMKAAPSHCGQVTTTIRACCCADAPTGTPATQPSTQTQLSPGATAVLSTLHVAANPLAEHVHAAALARSPHDRGRPLTVLYATFLI